MAKNETQIRKLVGRTNSNMENPIEGNYYVCDYIFDDSPDFHGATATVLRPVSKSEYEDRTDPENPDTLDRFEETWIEQVKAGQTQDGLREWTEFVLSVDGDEAIFDLSGYSYWDDIRQAEPELTEEDYPIFECIGGGRSFSKDMKFDKVYDTELWEQIKQVES